MVLSLKYFSSLKVYSVVEILYVKMITEKQQKILVIPLGLLFPTNLMKEEKKKNLMKNIKGRLSN